MLSVCIPIYNFDVVDLAKKLSSQAVAASVPTEVVFLDDGSDLPMLETNQVVESFEKVKFFQQENQGRSASRNNLAELATGNFLIFIDADCDVESDFLQKYISNMDSDKVVVGGLKYGPRPKRKPSVLRWKVGVKKEVRSLKKRLKSPYASFLTSNFLIPKRVMKSITFEEMPGGYGHEDTLFGYALQSAQVEIVHIENSVTHLGIDDSILYLKKLEQSIDNLAHLLRENPLRDDFKLLNCYKTLKSWGISTLFYRVFKFFEKCVKLNLNSHIPSLFLLDMYKLYLLIGKVEVDMRK